MSDDGTTSTSIALEPKHHGASGEYPDDERNQALHDGG